MPLERVRRKANPPLCLAVSVSWLSRDGQNTIPRLQAQALKHSENTRYWALRWRWPPRGNAPHFHWGVQDGIALDEVWVSVTTSKKVPGSAGLPFRLQHYCNGYLLPRHPLCGAGTYTWDPASQPVRCRGDSCNESLRPPLLPFCIDDLPYSWPGLSAGGCARSFHRRTEMQLTRSVGFDLLNSGHFLGLGFKFDTGQPQQGALPISDWSSVQRWGFARLRAHESLR